MTTIIERSFECGDNSRISFIMKPSSMVADVVRGSNFLDNNSESNTFIEENSFGAETLNQKMSILNSEIYQKIPSKIVHKNN